MPDTDELYQSILQEIVTGKLSPGSKLREAQLAEQFDISRTPLREVLFRLVMVGLLAYENNKGFHVPALSKRELQECYPIIWSLECLAVRSSSLFLQTKISTLTELNEQFLSASEEPNRALKYDSEFHNLLCSASGNATLQKIVGNLKARTERYDLVYFADAELIKVSYRQHQRIIDSIEQGEVDNACRHLEDNWRCGLEYFVGLVKD